MMNAAVAKGDISPPSAGDVNISHMIFADDLMIFSEAKPSDAAGIRQVLDDFATYAGLDLNVAKSQIFFSKNCDRMDISSILGVEEQSLPVRYLGLPLFSGMLKRDMCLPLLDKMRAKLDLWKGRLLSMAGRLELIISTLAAYNIFWSSSLPIPCSVTEEADRICKQFLWGDQEDKKRMHTVSWDMVCRPKNEGGLGIRKASDWVAAGVAKNLWNVISKKDSLWVRWIHGRYLKDTSI